MADKGAPKLRRRGHLRLPTRKTREEHLLVGIEHRQGLTLVPYDQVMAFEIVQLIADGYLLREVCAKGTGYVTAATFRRWAMEHPELAKAFKEAREISAHSLEEEAIATGREVRRAPGTSVDVRAAETLMGQLRWSAQRRDPAQFGDSAKVQIRVPVQINTNLNLGQEGAGPTLDHMSVYEIEARPEPSQETPEEAPVEQKTPFTLPAWYNGGPLPPQEEPILVLKPGSGGSISPKQRLVPRIPMDAVTPPAGEEAKEAVRLAQRAMKEKEDAEKRAIRDREQGDVRAPAQNEGESPENGGQEG